MAIDRLNTDSLIYKNIMDKGKQMCEILKLILKDVAAEYNVDYEPTECEVSGNCIGFCKHFDWEIRTLKSKIESEWKHGGEEKHPEGLSEWIVNGIYGSFENRVCELFVEVINEINRYRLPNSTVNSVGDDGKP